MRELEVAWSGFMNVELGRKDEDVDAVGRARPNIDPDAELERRPGVLAVSYRFPRGGVGSCEDVDDVPVRA